MICDGGMGEINMKDLSDTEKNESSADENLESIEAAMLRARQILQQEARAVSELSRAIDGGFRRAVERILASDGRMQLTGVGKSGLIARKIAATMSSTGTPAYFIHAGEALHGDLGMVTEEDIVLAISYSGETEELLQLVPAIKRIGADLFVLTSCPDSTLAERADLVLNNEVEEEACHLDLAPTSSTTAALALGDALALALAYVRGLDSSDFALYHPGGSLGRKLLTTVKEVMEIREQNPCVQADETLQQALFIMTDSRMGSTSVINEQGKLIGIITDGDVRRALKGDSSDLLEENVKKVMTSSPLTVSADMLAAEALKLMENKEINHLPIVDAQNHPLGMVNFQDLLRAKVW